MITHHTWLSGIYCLTQSMIVQVPMSNEKRSCKRVQLFADTVSGGRAWRSQIAASGRISLGSTLQL